MTKSYYCHITSWINSEGETYHYENQPVAVFKFAEKVDEIFENFLRGEIYAGYSPKSERLYKVSENVLNNFKRGVFECEIGSTLTYNRDRVVELAEEVLVGYNTEMRYRRSIHFCEEVMSGIAKAEEVKEELTGCMKLIESKIENCLDLINEETTQDVGITELGGTNTLLNKTRDSLTRCKAKLDKLVEQKDEILIKKARDLEATLARSGYKAPILKFSID